MNSIRKYRLAAGLSQLQLAQKVNRTKGCISLYEKGLRTPPIKVAKQIADCVGCSLEKLVEEEK